MFLILFCIYIDRWIIWWIPLEWGIESSAGPRRKYCLPLMRGEMKSISIWTPSFAAIRCRQHARHLVYFFILSASSYANQKIAFSHRSANELWLFCIEIFHTQLKNQAGTLIVCYCFQCAGYFGFKLSVCCLHTKINYVHQPETTILYRMPTTSLSAVNSVTNRKPTQMRHKLCS